MKPFLMGSETEYAVSGRTPDRPLDAGEVYELLADALRKERRWLPDAGGDRGLFLENAARLYLDYGGHPEYCTPECLTPAQLAWHDKAGEYLLRLARDRVQREQGGTRITLVKNNLDPVCPDLNTYGTHESYTLWAAGANVPKQLLPHLVTRILYAGAGALTSHAEGRGFELSQRARHLTESVGSDTTDDRAIYCSRLRNNSDQDRTGWIRLHLIGKDSQRAPLGTYLNFGVTGLLIERINRGQRVGDGLELARPVQALHEISRDPWLQKRVSLADGRQLTALEIQFAYLEDCAQAVQQGGMPEWAPEVLQHWEQTLTDLSRDPMLLADRLDAYCKLFIYEHELMRAGLDWRDLQRGMAKLVRLHNEYPGVVVGAILHDSGKDLGEETRRAFAKARGDLGLAQPGELDRMMFALRLHALDVHYHELGGLYDRLEVGGRVHPVILTQADVQRASIDPPPGGRALLRGTCIKEFHNTGRSVEWQYIYNFKDGQCVDMRDPFSAERRITKLPVVDEDDYYDIEEMLAELERE